MCPVRIINKHNHKSVIIDVKRICKTQLSYGEATAVQHANVLTDNRLLRKGLLIYPTRGSHFNGDTLMLSNRRGARKPEQTYQYRRLLTQPRQLDAYWYYHMLYNANPSHLYEPFSIFDLDSSRCWLCNTAQFAIIITRIKYFGFPVTVQRVIKAERDNTCAPYP